MTDDEAVQIALQMLEHVPSEMEDGEALGLLGSLLEAFCIQRGMDATLACAVVLYALSDGNYRRTLSAVQRAFHKADA